MSSIVFSTECCAGVRCVPVGDMLQWWVIEVHLTADQVFIGWSLGCMSLLSGGGESLRCISQLIRYVLVCHSGASQG